jgi:hypothetical protein
VRRLVFAAATVALGAALLLVGLHRTRPIPSGSAAPRPLVHRFEAGTGRRPRAVGAGHQARLFVTAFLAYEVGLGGRRAEAAIRRGASPAFAEELLAHRPTPSGGPVRSPARIASLKVHAVPGHPDLALVSGEALRPAGPEPFAFLFARRDGRWRAVAPGE